MNMNGLAHGILLESLYSVHMARCNCEIGFGYSVPQRMEREQFLFASTGNLSTLITVARILVNR